jgi:acyl transferase domain-containing protein
VNGPSSVTVSGDPAALDELMVRCGAEGVRATRVAVDYASHSPQVEAIRDDLIAVLAGIAPQPPMVPFLSTVADGIADAADLGAEYWYRNLREPVRFVDAVRALAGPTAPPSTGHRCSPAPDTSTCPPTPSNTTATGPR